MKKISKRMSILKENLNKRFETQEDIIKAIKQYSNVKFTESIDLCVILGIDPAKSDQAVRTSFVLPHGTNKKKKVLAFVPAEKYEDAKKAGADVVGSEDLIEDIKSTEKVPAQVCVCTPDMFPKVAKIAKILGKAGAMPNMKDGTVSANIEDTITQIKLGKQVRVKSDSSAQIKLSIGHVKMGEKELIENIKCVYNAIQEAKPAKVKKQMIKKAFISSTMGLSIEFPTK